MIVTNHIPTYLFSLYYKSDYEYLFSMSTGTMSSFSSDFDETTVMFLKFIEDLNSPTGESPLVDDNLGEFNGMLTHNYLNLYLTLTCYFNLFSINYSTISDS